MRHESTTLSLYMMRYVDGSVVLVEHVDDVAPFDARDTPLGVEVKKVRDDLQAAVLGQLLLVE